MDRLARARPASMPGVLVRLAIRLFQVVSTVIVRDDPTLRLKVVSAETAMMVPQKPGQTAHHPRKPTRSISPTIMTAVNATTNQVRRSLRSCVHWSRECECIG